MQYRGHSPSICDQEHHSTSAPDSNSPSAIHGCEPCDIRPRAHLPKCRDRAFGASLWPRRSPSAHHYRAPGRAVHKPYSRQDRYQSARSRACTGARLLRGFKWHGSLRGGTSGGKTRPQSVDSVPNKEKLIAIRMVVMVTFNDLEQFQYLWASLRTTHRARRHTIGLVYTEIQWSSRLPAHEQVENSGDLSYGLLDALCIARRDAMHEATLEFVWMKSQQGFLEFVSISPRNVVAFGRAVDVW
jgi:hypothetical protein